MISTKVSKNTSVQMVRMFLVIWFNKTLIKETYRGDKEELLAGEFKIFLMLTVVLSFMVACTLPN